MQARVVAALDAQRAGRWFEPAKREPLIWPCALALDHDPIKLNRVMVWIYLFGRIFYGEPVPTAPENALCGLAGVRPQGELETLRACGVAIEVPVVPDDRLGMSRAQRKRAAAAPTCVGKAGMEARRALRHRGAPQMLSIGPHSQIGGSAAVTQITFWTLDRSLDIRRTHDGRTAAVWRVRARETVGSTRTAARPRPHHLGRFASLAPARRRGVTSRKCPRRPR